MVLSPNSLRSQSLTDATALTSACPSPQRRCHPSPIILPPGAAITAPTIGLGDANPLPFSARAIALRMYNSLSINQTVKFMPYLVNDRLVNHQ
jgi:hypothetical protein